jgi:hypothetical protein
MSESARDAKLMALFEFLGVDLGDRLRGPRLVGGLSSAYSSLKEGRGVGFGSGRRALSGLNDR